MSLSIQTGEICLKILLYSIIQQSRQACWSHVHAYVMMYFTNLPILTCLLLIVRPNIQPTWTRASYNKCLLLPHAGKYSSATISSLHISVVRNMDMCFTVFLLHIYTPMRYPYIFTNNKWGD